MKFRGMTEQGEWVEGHYCEVGGLPYIIKMDTPLGQNQYGTYIAYDDLYEIIPESLAMSTTQIDKNKKEIFGSILLEDGTMSKGGDRVKMNPLDDDWDDDVLWWQEKARFELKSYIMAIISVKGKNPLEVLSVKATMCRFAEHAVAHKDNDNPCEVIGNQMDFEAGKEK